MSLPANDLRQYLSGSQEPLATLDWLQNALMPAVQAQLCSVDVRRRLALYTGERIPENERNLTDVRNRVSLIIEYELARVATRLIEDGGVTDLFLSYVVANRFPDLEVRTATGARGLRIEVKCLQSIAEEKSANFDTLRKDVHPTTDFVVVFLWEWKHDQQAVKWDRAPFIERVFVFHAASLAHLRDWYWLNCPPSDPGDGLQGFDLRYAVNCNHSNFNVEEGNYGKLLRLWSADFDYQPPRSPLLDRTSSDHIDFQRSVVRAGFDNLSDRLLPQLASGVAKTAVVHEGKPVGWRSGDFVFVLQPLFSGTPDFIKFLQNIGGARVISFSPKYAWKECALVSETKNGRQYLGVRTVQFVNKPKLIPQTLLGSQPLTPAQAIAAGQDES